MAIDPGREVVVTVCSFDLAQAALVASIKDGTARVVNECGEWWDEDPNRLRPAAPGFTW